MATTNSGNLTVQPAQGVRGFLIRGLGSQIWFRVYGKDHSFVDYDITNHDCEIEIVDPDAALICSERGDFLDYTPESMNVVENSDPESTPD